MSTVSSLSPSSPHMKLLSGHQAARHQVKGMRNLAHQSFKSSSNPPEQGLSSVKGTRPIICRKMEVHARGTHHFSNPVLGERRVRDTNSNVMPSALNFKGLYLLSFDDM